MFPKVYTVKPKFITIRQITQKDIATISISDSVNKSKFNKLPHALQRPPIFS